MTKEFVENLGWKYTQLWNNREIYKFNDTDFTIVEHNGSWSIAFADDLYYIECVTEKMLEEFTNYIKEALVISSNPDNHTLGEYTRAVKKISDFYNKYEDYESEDFDENV